MTYSLRLATAGDAGFLWAMLYEASYAAENGVPDVAALHEHLDVAGGRFGAVSLSVRAENPAWRLYERTGFRVALERETGESTAGESVTMKFELRGLTRGSGAG
jgi:hypothetical protein